MMVNACSAPAPRPVEMIVAISHILIDPTQRTGLTLTRKIIWYALTLQS